MELGYAFLVPFATTPTIHFIKTMKNKQQQSIFETMQQKDAIEEVIRNQQKKLSYNTVDYPLEHFLGSDISDEQPKPLPWTIRKQSRFIETLLLGLPTLKIVAKTKDWEIEQIFYGEVRLKVCKGFVGGFLTLNGCQVPQLNGVTFNDLPLSRQRWFKRLTVKTLAIDDTNENDYFYWLEAYEFMGF